MKLTVGKLRRLQQSSTPDGFFVIVALDQRAQLRETLNPGNPDAIGYAEMVSFKLEVTRTLAPACSAVLLDPQYGAAQAVTAGILSGQTGLLVALGTEGVSAAAAGPKRGRVLDGWSIEKTSRMGASAVRLKIAYHPKARNAAEQESLIHDVAVQCFRYDIPFFLEPVIQPPNGNSRLGDAARREAVIETAARLSGLGIDVLLSEFPGATDHPQDEATMRGACRELNDASRVPWALTCTGSQFDRLLKRLEVAAACGASGVMAGPVVWREAAEGTQASRSHFLATTALERVVALGDAISEYGRPWIERRQDDIERIDEAWYLDY